MHSSTISQPRSPHGTSPGAAAAREADAPVADQDRAVAVAADLLPPAAVQAVEFEQMRGNRGAALHLVDMHDVEPVAGTRIVFGAPSMPPIAARSARRPMRPMPLMPTRIAQPPAARQRARRPRADLVEPRLERHAIELGKGQVGEDLDPAVQAGVELVQHRRALGPAARELGRVGQRPGRR